MYLSCTFLNITVRVKNKFHKKASYISLSETISIMNVLTRSDDSVDQDQKCQLGPAGTKIVLLPVFTMMYSELNYDAPGGFVIGRRIVLNSAVVECFSF